MQSCIAGLYNQPFYGDAISNNPGGGGLTITDNVFAGTRASQMSLAAIVSVGGACPAPNPSAPPGVVDDGNGNGIEVKDVGVTVKDEEEVVISGVGLSPTKQKNEEILVQGSISPPPQDETNVNSDHVVDQETPLTGPSSTCPLDEHYQDWERPPPYAPDHLDPGDSPATRLIDNETVRPEAVNPDAPKLLARSVGGENNGNAGNSSLALTPTYEASKFGAVSLRDVSDDGVSLRGDLTYNPLYTYYDTVGKAPE